MAAKIEHLVKYEAYGDALAWSRGSDKESIIWWLKQKHESHLGHLQVVGPGAFMGTPPRNRFFNWLGHKFLCWAWGRNSYFTQTLSKDWSEEKAMNDDREDRAETVIDYDDLRAVFHRIGVPVEEHEERHNTWHKDAIPTEATKFLSTGIAHYHFDKDGKYLGTECNGDGTFVKATK